MNAINSAYPLIDAQTSQAVTPSAAQPSFWRRVLDVLSMAGMAALVVG